VKVCFRANGDCLFARRSGEPLARLRLTGNGDGVVLLSPSPTAAAGRRSAISGRAPCRSMPPRSTSATIHTSRTREKPKVEPHQRIDAWGEGRSLETSGEE
jgi:hypothetical protein